MLNIKQTVPQYTLLVSIDYKYNYFKDVYLILTEVLGITNPGITYLSGYPENFRMFPFDLFSIYRSYLIFLGV